MEPVEPWRLERPRRQGPRFRRGPLLAGVAGLAVLGLGAAGVVVLISGDDKDDADQVRVARLAGSLFAGDPKAITDGRDQELNGVGASGSTVVAVGSENGPLGGRGQFLVSTDGGRSFKLAAVKAADGGEPGPGEIPRQVARTPEGWVGLGEGPGGYVTWTSTDAKLWRRTSGAAVDFGPDARIEKIAGSAAGTIAVGAVASKGDLSDAAGAVWLSKDGRTWERLTGDSLDLGLGEGTLTLTSVASNGKAILMLGAHTRNSGEQARIRRMVWRSDDGGRTWADAKVPSPPGNAGLSLTGGPPGFAAIREIRKGKTAHAQAFLSNDGRTWTEGGELKVDGYRRVAHVIAGEETFAAAVMTREQMILLRSRDGASWQMAGTLPRAPGRVRSAIAVTSANTITAGWTAKGSDRDAALSVHDANGTEAPIDLLKIAGAQRADRTVRAVLTAGARMVATGDTNGDAALWTSSDGVVWTRVQTTGSPRRQSLVSVSQGGKGWLAVGYDDRRPLVTLSADGRTWRAVEGEEAFQSGGRTLTTNASAAGPAGYVIVGEDGSSAATWFSADLKSWERGKAGADGALQPKSGDYRMRAVTAGASGFVATGGATDPSDKDAKQGPAVWASANGRTWTLKALPAPSGVTVDELSHIAAKGGAAVVLGTGQKGPAPVAVAYASADGGKAWREVRLPAPAGGATVTAVTATTTGFAATGTTGRPGGLDTVYWTSADGLTWTMETPQGTGLSGRGDQQINALTTVGGDLLGVGLTTDHRGDEPTLWRRPPG